MQTVNSKVSLSSQNNKRIAKNTMMLYFRMLLIMGVTLYTVRVVLNVLGAEDYGIYNVVGGIVIMFSFLSNTMATASQRFFAYELGRNNLAQLKKTFSMTLSIYVLIAIIILIMAETVGLWFLNTQMTIPENRMEAANWVYQFSIFSFMMTMFTIPYYASIIAHERMNIYAYASIAEALLKLGILYLLVLFSVDKLKLYAILVFVVTASITVVYRIYCKRQFEECKYKFYWDKPLFKELIGYSGWNLFGALAALCNVHGINILLNVFFGPVVNAANAVAYRVSSAINQFVMNFLTAVKPQITKYYAVGKVSQMINLVCQSSKYSFFLLLILSMPILLETNFVFRLWLEATPEYVVLFTRLVVVNALVNSLSYPLMTAAQATGMIKKYQTIVGSVMLLNIPLAYIALKVGLPAQSALYIGILISLLCLYLRLKLLKTMINLSITRYRQLVLNPVGVVIVISYILPVLIHHNMSDSLLRFLIVSIVGGVSSLFSIYVFGLNSDERSYIHNLFMKFYSKCGEIKLRENV
ncbi:MAG: oligosaccharide flippase family protein [Bacteroidales bacterium]|nr:oligosaccharide flippase family protein [Bacteroidales bacterium]